MGVLEIVATVRLREVLRNEWVLIPAGFALAVPYALGAYAILFGVLAVLFAFKIRSVVSKGHERWQRHRVVAACGLRTRGRGTLGNSDYRQILRVAGVYSVPFSALSKRQLVARQSTPSKWSLTDNEIPRSCSQARQVRLVRRYKAFLRKMSLPE